MRIYRLALDMAHIGAALQDEQNYKLIVTLPSVV